MEKEKVINYNTNDRAIVSALRTAGQSLTLDQINEATGLKLIPGNIVGAMRKGLVVATGEAEAPATKKSTVSVYQVVSTDTSAKDAKGNSVYTASELEIMKALVDNNIDTFILSELSELVGRKLASGSINALSHKKGNLAKIGERQVISDTTKTVKLYGLNPNFPTDFDGEAIDA